MHTVHTYVHMCNSVSVSCGTYVCYRHCSVVILSGFVSMFVETLWDVLDGDDDERLVSATTGPLDPTDRVAHKVHQPLCSPVTSNNHLTSCHITSPSPSPHLMSNLTLTSCSSSPHPHFMLTITSPHFTFTLTLPSLTSPHLVFTLTSPSLHAHPHLTSPHVYPHLTFTSCPPSPHLTLTLTLTSLTHCPSLS